MPAKKEHRDSDPLPYTQFHRSARPKAARLAALINVTVQHAIGTLIEWWDLNGDPRDIERLIEQGKREVVLTADQVRKTFRIASGGHDIDPESLEVLGLVEATAEGCYRICGMSRFFEPVQSRVDARAAAIAGGKASAAARREKYGTAQPRSEVGSGSGSTPVRAPVEASPNDPRTEGRTGSEPALEPPANTEESGERSAVQKTLSLPGTDAVERIFAHWQIVMKKPRARLDDDRRELISDRLKEGFTPDDICKSVDGYASDPWSMGRNDRNKAWNSIELICRDAAHVERGLDFVDRERPRSQAPPAPELPDTPAGRCWAQLLQELRSSDPPSEYVATQLAQLEPIELGSRAITLRARDSYFAEWCLDHYGELVQRMAGVEMQFHDPGEWEAA